MRSHIILFGRLSSRAKATIESSERGSAIPKTGREEQQQELKDRNRSWPPNLAGSVGWVFLRISPHRASFPPNQEVSRGMETNRAIPLKRRARFGRRQKREILDSISNTFRHFRFPAGVACVGRRKETRWTTLLYDAPRAFLTGSTGTSFFSLIANRALVCPRPRNGRGGKLGGEDFNEEGRVRRVYAFWKCRFPPKKTELGA